MAEENKQALSNEEAAQIIAEAGQYLIDPDEGDLESTLKMLDQPQTATFLVNAILLQLTSERTMLENISQTPEQAAEDSSLSEMAALRPEDRAKLTLRHQADTAKIVSEFRNISGSFGYALQMVNEKCQRILDAANVLGIEHNYGVLSQPEDKPEDPGRS